MRTDKNAWHTVDTQYFHFCLDCETGRNAMQAADTRQWGTGGKSPCRDCLELRETGRCFELAQAHAAMDDDPRSPEEVDA